ncbi:hypothetical protein KJ570_03535 [Patescibacteria group bacterium]|nr:hypothetical protein [Patescibacteria group bacterium]MBU2035891.1 hypothetical protein [Patescibacteria group bacterium]
MKKIETTWHHLLWSALEKHQFKHTQKSLADYFGYSLSTINLAIKKAEAIGAIKMSGKFFVLSDPKKLLFYWATHRDLDKDYLYKTYSSLPISEIEGLIPPQSIIGGFSAAKKILGEAPSDYSKVFFYLPQEEIETATKRYPPSVKEPKNIFILKSYPKQKEYGQIATLPQTFVDLWNLPDWYAKDFLTSLEEKIDELLS